MKSLNAKKTQAFTIFALFALLTVLISCAPQKALQAPPEISEKAPEARESEERAIPQIEITPIMLPPKPEIEPPPTPPNAA